MNSSKLTSKYQATIPKEIRKSLKLQPGDTIVFQIDDSGKVTVKKFKPIDRDYLEALNKTLSEWDSEEDEDAYENLQKL